jgi:hypothetical protein
MNNKKEHVVLIGDSILDNKSYVRKHPDVATQLQHKVQQREWKVSLRARDGDVMEGIPTQCILFLFFFFIFIFYFFFVLCISFFC